MTNPWLKRNPYMSMWLSGCNAMASMASVAMTQAMRRQAATLYAQSVSEAMRYWADALTPPRAAARRSTARSVKR